MTRLWQDWGSESKDSSLAQYFQTSSAVHPASYSMGSGDKAAKASGCSPPSSVRLRISGAIHQLPHMSSWRVLGFYLYLVSTPYNLDIASVAKLSKTIKYYASVYRRMVTMFLQLLHTLLSDVTVMHVFLKVL
jgi:hypothetical protein